MEGEKRGGRGDKKISRNFLDSRFYTWYKNQNQGKGMTVHQFSGVNFSGGYYFWFYYAGVCLPPGS